MESSLGTLVTYTTNYDLIYLMNLQEFEMQTGTIFQRGDAQTLNYTAHSFLYECDINRACSKFNIYIGVGLPSCQIARRPSSTSWSGPDWSELMLAANAACLSDRNVGKIMSGNVNQSDSVWSQSCLFSRKKLISVGVDTTSKHLQKISAKFLRKVIPSKPLTKNRKNLKNTSGVIIWKVIS